MGLEYASMMHNARLLRSGGGAHFHPGQEAKRTHIFDDLRDSFEKHHLRDTCRVRQEQNSKRRQKLNSKLNLNEITHKYWLGHNSNPRSVSVKDGSL